MVALLKNKREAFLKKKHQLKIISNTSLPFFDIEYRTILKIILKNFDNEQENAPKNNEIVLLNKNFHIFERIFGFKFDENKSLSAIKNQSFIGLDLIYPELYDEIQNEGKSKTGTHTESKKNSGTKSNKNEIGNTLNKSIFLERENKKKSFHAFNEPSTILTDTQSFIVS